MVATAIATQAAVIGVFAIATGTGFPPLTVWQVAGLRIQPDPTTVTRQPVWPAVHWGSVVVIGAALLALGLVGIALQQRGWSQTEALRKGTANRRELRRHAGARQLVGRASRLRPSLAGQRVRPEQVGYRLGTSRGVAVWMSVEDSMILVGPSRSGKGRNFVVPMLKTAMGAVVTTSTRPDNLLLTIEHRERLGGPVYVFDPAELVPQAGHVLRWSPLEGAEDLDVAMRRLRSLIPTDGFSNVQNSGYWEATSKKIILALFHAAALERRTIEDFWQWISDPNLARSDALEILNTHPHADRATARSLAAVLAATAEQRGNDWAAAYADVAYMASPKVRASMLPGPDDARFEPRDFVTSSGTLYLVGDASLAAAFEPLIVALVEELSYTAQHIAAGSPGARLDPPIQFILDEAASFKIPTLPKLISYAGGSGLTMVVVLQSLAQAEVAWGADAARALWGAASLRMVLPGVSDPRDLRDLATLSGEVELERTSVTSSAGGTSIQRSRESKQVLRASDIRTLPPQTGLLLHRRQKPALVSLRGGLIS